MKTHRLFVSSAALGLALVLGAAPAGAGQKVEFSQIASQWDAKDFLEGLPWERYDATKISIAEESSWHDPAMFLDLKGDPWTVEFMNDRFLSFDRRHYGDLSEPEPVKGDIKEAAMKLLERDQLKVYRVRIAGKAGGGPDEAIVLTPYSINAVASGDVIRVRLDQAGLEAREGDDLGGYSLSLPRGIIRGRHRGKKTNGNTKKGDGDDGDYTFYGRYTEGQSSQDK